MEQVCNLLGCVEEHHKQTCLVLLKVLCQPHGGLVQHNPCWGQCSSHTFTSPAEFQAPSTHLKHACIKQYSELEIIV